MERERPIDIRFDPAHYRICILGTLDEQWSDYLGGMTIKYANDAKRGVMSILMGCLTDQAALIGILTALYDLGCPILSVEYQEAS
jgi:hypothetical protein